MPVRDNCVEKLKWLNFNYPQGALLVTGTTASLKDAMICKFECRQVQPQGAVDNYSA